MYDGWPFVGEEPPTLRYLGDEDASLIGMRGVALWEVELLNCAAFWSNLLFRSFTLGGGPPRPPYAAVAATLDFEVPPGCVSSIGADTERTAGLPGRVEDTAGWFRAVTFPFDRDERL